MQNVVLIIHLLLAVTLIGLVLLQRSEGGGLGIGGGGGGVGYKRCHGKQDDGGKLHDGCCMDVDPKQMIEEYW